VVRGATLAEEAGRALEEIEEVSNYIASQTKEIADAAKHESQETSKVDEGMTVIQAITTKTADDARRTAAAIGELTKLAEELQRSVAGFTLPH
jgi:twitching motility protein PilJ